MKQLSFKLHPLDSIIQQGNILFPGAVRVIALFYDESKNSVFQLENNLKSNTIKNVILNKQITNNFRASSNNKYWISSSELGYVESKEKIKQLSLEDELQNNSLVLKFLNEFDEKYDVLVVQFNRDKNNFELEANPQPLNTTNKSIIGHLLFNSLSASIDTHYQNRKIFEQIIKSNIGLNHNLEQTKTLLKSAQKQYIESLKNILKQYLTPIEEETKISFNINEDVFEKLKNFTGSSKELQQIIEQGANIAINLSFSTDVELRAEHVLLEEYHIKENQRNKTTSERVEIPFSRYNKTIQLLDRYEKSARVLLEKDLPLTSKNVGNYCTPPISAPAISDAIKKHKKKILSLLEMHPNKWEIIRDEFKPILNIQPNGPDLGKILLGA